MPKLKLKDTLNRVVRVDTDAGATLGVNLRDQSGRVIKPSEVLNSAAAGATTGAGSGYANTLWRLIREIPNNIRALAGLAGSGFARRADDGTWALEEPDPVAPQIPVVTGEIVDGQPVFVYLDDGSLVTAEV